MRDSMEGEILEEFEVGGQRIVFRYPRWDDLDAFIKMHQTLTDEKVMARRLSLDRSSSGRILADILVNIKEGRQSYLLIDDGSEIIGEGFVQKSGHDYMTIGLALIERVRGKGIGTKLMWALEWEARRLGSRRMDLTVWEANPSAIHIYEKLGYEVMGRRPGWVLMDNGEECDLIDMIKNLEEGDY